ncbi:BREX system serine/threonine kinase PglW [Nocardioides perillae]|uniref:Serine/threonine protein kinase n=1 Tax=Nocardioides perillae TaxID=1119534 RepID=A0A7Y9RU56_9ACTN|nr:serine/threonine protein kinase [Nocardioides perillae]
MRADSGRWTEIAPSRFPHEREGLEHVRAELPDAAPYHAWSNFEFVALDGTPHEVDLLVLGPAGFHLVELKAWSGRIELDPMGGEHDWLEHVPGRGRPLQRRSPLGLTRLKAQSFRSWLERHARGTATGVPFVHESLFLHGPGVDCRLPQHLKARVFGREDAAGNRLGRIVLDRLAMPPNRGAGVSESQARGLVRLLERAGLRRPAQPPRVGQWRLEAEPLDAGWGWQDTLAVHDAFTDERVRVRRWFVPPGTSAHDEVAVRQAAEREFRMLRGLDHPGLVTPTEYLEVEGAVAALVFPHDPGAVELGSWLAGAGRQAGLDRRLDLVRAFSEVVRYAHDHGLVHRGLRPKAVLVSADEAVRVKDWQAAGRAEAGTATATTHARDLLEHDHAASLYAAPEALLGAAGDRRVSDVFSVGAIAYEVLTGVAPAAHPDQLRQRLSRDGGLDVAAVLDGAPETLVDLLREATAPVVADRLPSIDDLIAGLDLVLEELTAPDEEPRLAVDPLDAAPGDELEGGLVVVRALGEGATSKAMLVRRADGTQAVLKAARDHSRSGRLVEEAASLRRLPEASQLVRLLDGPLEVGGRTCLLLDVAGERSLAHHLGRGRLTLDQLRRWGRDLLEVLAVLERAGTFHRDVKPANLGVRTRSTDGQPHLVLYDFSLAAVPATDLAAGTAGYRDPFLGPPARLAYDAAAELFSGAVTLHEMATGALPVWGDGITPAALQDGEVVLHRAAFDQVVADGLLAFFRRALARDVERRFDNADDMLQAWERIFVDAERQQATRTPDEEAAAATLTTPLATSGLSPQAVSALEQHGVATVGDLVTLSAFDLARTPGATQSTKDELVRRARQWRATLTSDSTPTAASVDAVLQQVLPEGDDVAARAVRLVLGQVDEVTGAGPLAWPTAAVLRNELGADRSVVADAWSRFLPTVADSRLVQEVRDQVFDLVAGLGGVATADEVAQRLLERRGSHAGGEQRHAQGLALVRVAVESAPGKAVVRRAGDVLLVTADTQLDLTAADDALEAAARLGRSAQDLCQGDALAAPATVVEVLRAVVTGTPLEDLPEVRLRELAAAAGGIAVSARGELYPRGMSAVRALRLSAGALVPGSGGLHPRTIQQRVRARFPEAQAVPDRPRLTDLLEEAGVALTWGGDAYVAPASLGTSRSSVTASSHHAGSAPEDVRTVDARLRRSIDERGFLALAVPQRYAGDAVVRLEREHGASRCDVDAWVLEQLHEESRQHGVGWGFILRTDARSLPDPDRVQLDGIVRRVASNLEEHVRHQAGPVLLVGAGLLARHRCVDLLEPLASLATARSHAVWLLAPQPSAAPTPTLDGAAVPLASPTQWLALPSRWAVDRPTAVPA